MFPPGHLRCLRVVAARAGRCLHRWQLPCPSNQQQQQQRATFVDVKKIGWVRDRGLDHAVEKEKHLLPFLSLKDCFLVTPSSQSAPPSFCTLSSIVNNRHLLSLPPSLSPISFIRRFPAAYDITPSSLGDPATIIIRPTPELLRLHQEELSLHDHREGSSSSSLRDEAADRLLRLLMLSRTRSVPLELLHRLRLDLGLPRDFPDSLLPHYPHYFHLHHPSRRLDLVFWDRRLAVSTFQTKSPSSSSSSSFPLHYSRGFVIDKRVAKWMEEWQRLPYLSPYDEEDGARVDPKTPLGEKFAVGVLHELLHLLIPKKTARDGLMLLAELAGLQAAACKKLLINYPGIFYVSNKNNTYTVVLREAYKRGVLAGQKHPLMEMRYKYIHLMHKPVEEDASCGKKRGGRKSRKAAVATDHDALRDNNDYFHEDYDDDDPRSYEEDHVMKEEEEEDDDDDEQEGEFSGSSDFESEKGDDMPLGRELPNAREMPATGATRERSMRTTRGRRDMAPSNRLSSIERHLKTRKMFQDPSDKQRKQPHGNGPTLGVRRTNARRKPMLNART